MLSYVIQILSIIVRCWRHQINSLKSISFDLLLDLIALVVIFIFNIHVIDIKIKSEENVQIIYVDIFIHLLCPLP